MITGKVGEVLVFGEGACDGYVSVGGAVCGAEGDVGMALVIDGKTGLGQVIFVVEGDDLESWFGLVPLRQGSSLIITVVGGGQYHDGSISGEVEVAVGVLVVALVEVPHHGALGGSGAYEAVGCTGGFVVADEVLALVDGVGWVHPSGVGG